MIFVAVCPVFQPTRADCGVHGMKNAVRPVLNASGARNKIRYITLK